MSFILDWLYPCSCYGCGRPGKYFCPQCTAKLIYCSIKPNHPIGFDGTLSLFHYRGLIKSTINDLKFKFISDLVPELSALITTSLKEKYPHLLEYWRQSAFTLIPIPLHPSRSRWRGFNQSELLVSSLSLLLDIPCYTDILFRHRFSSPQSLVKNKTLRRQNISSAFSLHENTIPPSKIILFDDVATTGSTLSSALSAFPKTTEAWALTIAG
jgi:ComF family protein